MMATIKDDHLWVEVTDKDYLTKHMTPNMYTWAGTKACWICGLWERQGSSPSYESCGDCQVSEGMKPYRVGGVLDPFKTVRGLGMDGAPVRVAPVEEHFDTGWQKETRPGLAEETIDRQAHDDFMRGL